MKKSVLCLVALTLSNLAFAENNYYISLQSGVSIPTKTAKFEPAERASTEPEVTKERFKNSVIYDLTVGRRVYKNTFVELEAAYAPTHKFSKNTRLDLAGTGTPLNYVVKTKLKTTNIFANASYQFHDVLPMSIVPYVTGGLGYSSNKIKSTTLMPSGFPPFTTAGKTTNNFAWQLGAGLLFPVTKSLYVNLSYKFRDLGKIKTTGNYFDTVTSETLTSETPLFKGKLRSSNVLLGVSYNF